MTNKERFLAAMNLMTPDMVPLWEMGINEAPLIGIARTFTDKVPAPKFLHEMSMEEQINFFMTYKLVIENLDLDGFTVPTVAGREILDSRRVRDRFGVVLGINEHGEPFPIEGPIASPEDLKSYRIPTADDSFLLGVRLAKSMIGDSRAVVLHSPGTFKMSWSLRGKMETLLTDYIVNPELAHRLARMTTDFCKQLFEGALRMGADMIILEGDLAMNTTTLMSPKHYREFIKPYHAELTACVHANGGKIAKHSDGNLWPILDDLIEAGFDGVHPIQPQCMDIGEVKGHCTGKVCVLGNIDCMEILTEASVEDVERTVRETIAAAAKGGGYIMSSSNSIHPGCRVENYIAMVRACRKYGRYD